MYAETINRGWDREKLFVGGGDPALVHRGDYRELLRIHAEHAALMRGGRNVCEIGPYLMNRMADERTMRFAIDKLSTRQGACTPGPDGIRLTDLSEYEKWELARSLASSVQGGTFRPGPIRLAKFQKGRAGATVRSQFKTSKIGWWAKLYNLLWPRSWTGPLAKGRSGSALVEDPCTD